MLDKIYLRSPVVVEPQALMSKLSDLGFTLHLKSDNYWNYKFTCYRENKLLFAVGTQPKTQYASPLRIEFNPTNFKSPVEVEQVVYKITEGESPRICRVDCYADLNLEVLDVKTKVRLPRKRCREKYGAGDKLNGIYIGQPPEQICIYDRLKKHPNLPQATRLEVRRWDKKVPIPNFDNWRDYLHHNPFSKLEALKVNNQLLTTSENEQIQHLLEAYGLQGTIKRLNRNKNFKRDFSGIFVKDDSFPDMSQIHKNDISNFFGEQFYEPKSQAS